MNTNRNIWTIMKKELSRFFGDRRIVISTILLPGLLIYIMYSFMGNALAKNYGTDEDAPFHIAAVALPATIEVCCRTRRSRSSASTGKRWRRGRRRSARTIWTR